MEYLCPSVSPLVRPSVRKKNLDHIYTYIESKIHIRSHALAKRKNFKMEGHQVDIWLYGSLGSIIFVFAPFS